MRSWIVLFIISPLVIAGPAMAVPTWVSLGFGPGTASSSGSGQAWIGSRLAVQWGKGSTLWTVASAGCSEIDLFVDPLESVGDMGVLYGKRWSGPVGYISASAGLALVNGMRRGEYRESSGVWFITSHYEKDPFVTVGVPANVQLVLAPIKYFGLALDLFGNVNPERSFGGATVSLLIGKMR